MTQTAAGAKAPQAAVPAPGAIRHATRAAATRHPLDPEPVRSTKAAAVLALGIAAVVTGPLVGGIVPGVVSLMLARQASDDIAAGRGYLTGGRHLRTGRIFAWVGIALAVTALVVASVIGVLSLAAGAGQDFPDTSN